MRTAATPRRPVRPRRSARPSHPLVPALGFEAATVGLFAVLHLSGALQIGPSGRSYGAGIAEALICLALAAGAVALVRAPARGRRAALAALGFAIFGFLVGLSFTLDSGDAIDLAYHLTMLPILVVTAILLAGQPAARDL